MGSSRQWMAVSVLGEPNMSNCFWGPCGLHQCHLLFLLVAFHLLSFNSESKYIFPVLVKMFFPIFLQSAMESKSGLPSLKLVNTRYHIWSKYLPFHPCTFLMDESGYLTFNCVNTSLKWWVFILKMVLWRHPFQPQIAFNICLSLGLE